MTGGQLRAGHPSSKKKSVSAAAPVVTSGKAQAKGLGSKAKPPLHPTELDSFIAVRADGKVMAFFGKMDMGQGLDVAISQIVAEELDVAYEKVTTQMSDTGTSVNQGGASGSNGIKRGGKAMSVITTSCLSPALLIHWPE